MKMILHDFVTEHGIDTSSSVPLRDLAVELLGCLSLARRLARAKVEAAVDRKEPAKAEGRTSSSNDSAQTIEQLANFPDSPQSGKKDREKQTEKYRIIIIKCLVSYQDGDFYIGDKISEYKEKMARQYFPVPDNEKIIGLIDTTFLGICDEGMAICEGGIYWRNSPSRTLKKNMTWGELITIKDHIFSEKDKIYMGGNYFEPGGDKLSAKYIARMIHDLVERLENS